MNKLLSTFKLFGLSYFIYLILSIGAVVGLVFLLKNTGEKRKKIVNIVIVSVGALFVLFDFLARMLYFKGSEIGENLPLNIYHIFLYVCIFITMTEKESWVKFGYLIMLPVTLYSLIFVPDFYCLQSSFSLGVLSFYVINISVVLFIVLNLIWNNIYFEKKDVISSFLNYMVMISATHIFNVFLRFSTWGVHADYTGTVGEEYDLFTRLIASILPKDYGSLIVIVALLLYAIACGYLMIIPFEAIKNKKEKQNQYDELVALGNFKAQQDKRKNKGSQVLIRSNEKAKPTVEKNMTQVSSKDGFVSVTKEVKVNKDEK